MIESGFLLFFMIFEAVLISSLGWHIMIKGRGIPQNLWLFFVMMAYVFIFSAQISSYFPFSKIYFFVAVLISIIFSTLYVYSFPHGVMPRAAWNIFIILFILLSGGLFFYMPEFVYFLVPFFAIVLDIPIIVRKIKYLNTNVRKFVLFDISIFSLVSVILPVIVGFSLISYNAFYFNVAFLVLTTLAIINMAFFVYLSRNSFAGINRINFWCMTILAFFAAILVNLLFSVRFFIGYLSESVYFSLIALSSLFFIFMLIGIFISFFSSSIESFINKTRNYYQVYLNKYRFEMEDITDISQLFDKFYDSVISWFPEIKQLKCFYFEDFFAPNSKIPNEFYSANEDFQSLLRGQIFLHETYISKDSTLIFSPSLENFVRKTGGDFFIPLIYHGELNGFLVINSKKATNNVMFCINNMIEITLNKYEKLSLFATVVETEKKMEMLKNFNDTGKMLSFVAHELRSPVTSIMFNIEVVQDAIEKKKDIDAEYLDISLKELKRLNETVEKMLIYGRNIKLSPYPYNFRSFFAEMRQFFNYAGQVVNFADQTGGRDFLFDWDVLKNVFVNLINNSLQAVENSGRAGKINVSAMKKRKKLLIEVSDNGTGIPEEAQQSIFEPFYTTRKNGNGLGLATCEKIVRLSGGSIVLSDTSSAGTVFHITFPIESVSVK